MSKKYKQKAGDFIAAGAYGCVYKNPALKCANGIRPEGKVSKLMLKYNALEERDEYNNIDRIDPLFEYHYKKPDICKIPAKPNTLNDNNFKDCKLYDGNINGYYILEQEDGGLSLEDFANSKFTGPLRTIGIIKAREFLFIKIFYSMENLFNGLLEMDNHSYYHRDIKALNIVAKPKGNIYDIRFIDWGLASYGKYWNRFSSSMYFVRPPETFVFSDKIIRMIKQYKANRVNRPKTISDVIFILEKTYNEKYPSVILEKYFVENVPNNLNPYLLVEEDIGTYVDLISNGTYEEINRKKIEIIQKSDVFSLGIVLIHMWNDILGFRFQPNPELYVASSHHQYSTILSHIHSLITHMCCKSLDDRYRASKARKWCVWIKKHIDAEPSLSSQFTTVNQAPLAKVEPVVRKDCKKFKKTVNPKCDDQLECTWVKGKGCLNNQSNPENINLLQPDALPVAAPASPEQKQQSTSKAKRTYEPLEIDAKRTYEPLEIQAKRTHDVPTIYPFVQNKPCDSGKVFNPLTGYCIKSNGALAKKLRKKGIIK